MYLNHSDQRNNFCPQKVKYSWLQIWQLRWGTMHISIDLSFLSAWTLVWIQAPSPTLFSQIFHLTQWIFVWNFQIWIVSNFYALFYYQSIIFSLIWSFSNLICHSPLCFGYIQETAHMLLARSGATACNLLVSCGATTWVLLSKSGAWP